MYQTRQCGNEYTLVGAQEQSLTLPFPPLRRHNLLLLRPLRQRTLHNLQYLLNLLLIKPRLHLLNDTIQLRDRLGPLVNDL